MFSDTEEDNNNIIDKKPNADASAAVVSADNNDEEAENDQSIIIDKMGKTSDTSDGGGEHKAKFQQVLVPKTESPCCDPSCEAAASHDDKLPDSGASEHDGTTAAHAPLHPDTALRTVTIPQAKDVLFGRDRKAKSHLGNQMLRAICDNKRRIYDLADRDDKTEITRSIVHEIKSSGGSFLRFSKELQVWLVTGDDEARHKVGHMIRNGRPQPLGRLEPEMFPPVTTTKH